MAWSAAGSWPSSALRTKTGSTSAPRSEKCTTPRSAQPWKTASPSFAEAVTVRPLQVSIWSSEVGHTVYLSVIDAEGNIVSWIQSISDLFGSGVCVDGMGFHLHDRAGGMTLDPAQPNALAPRKRPFHTIIPGFMEKGDLHIGFGIQRGLNQAQAQAQFASNIADHRMNIQAALEAPRFTKTTLGGCDVRIESRVPAEAREELTRRGHWLTVGGEYSGYMGGGEAVLRDSANKVNYGASSPRKDGAAIPEPDPYFAPAARTKAR